MKNLKVNQIFSAVPGSALYDIIYRKDCISFSVNVREGLYQFSVIADGSGFNWNELYENLSKYGNKNIRTGPWDFSINGNLTPLIPSYWVSVNGRRLGLWFFQRITIPDLEAKRFRGSTALHLKGRSEIRFEPYRSFSVSWLSAKLENDIYDTCKVLPVISGNAEDLPGKKWGSEKFWGTVKKRLNNNLSVYSVPVEKACRWALEKKEKRSSELLMNIQASESHDLILLWTQYKLYGNTDALSKALGLIDYLLELPAWGNPQTDGYGHNGDFGAMYSLLWLSISLHVLEREMGKSRRTRLIARLRMQGNIFYDLLLLHRDYWGGSIVQDHGWRSVWGFAAAALHLFSIIPESKRWLSLALGRIERCISAMPVDGTIPAHSYHSVLLYLHELTYFRDSYLAASGIDIFNEPQFKILTDYISGLAEPSVFKANSIKHPGYRHLVQLLGGNYCLNRLAEKFSDRRLAWMSRKLAVVPYFTQGHALWDCFSRIGNVEGLLSDSLLLPCAPDERKSINFSYFQDSGRVQYRNSRSGASFSLQCGPMSGYNAFIAAPGPCDNTALAPAAGSFGLGLYSLPFINDALKGYGLFSQLGSCLLINNSGQKNSIGYPMSIPSAQYSGVKIIRAVYTEKNKTGYVRLDLMPAYDDRNLISYCRDFILCPGNEMHCRDHAITAKPANFSWLFQLPPSVEIKLKKKSAVIINGGHSLCVVPDAVCGAVCKVSEQDTPYIFGYSDYSRTAYTHLRFDSVKKETEVCIDFSFTWMCPENKK